MFFPNEDMAPVSCPRIRATFDAKDCKDDENRVLGLGTNLDNRDEWLDGDCDCSKKPWWSGGPSNP